MSQEISFLLSKINLFNALSAQEIEGISPFFQKKNFQKNDKIFLQGDLGKNLIILASGEVKLSSLNSEGEEMVIDIICDEGLLNQPFEERFLCSALVLKNAKILIIAKDIFQKLLSKNCNLSITLNKILSEKNNNLTRRILALKLSSAEEKIGSFLLKSSFAKNKKSPEFYLKFKKAIIAAYLGIKAETFSRTLKKILRSENLSLDKNFIKLNKNSSLCSFCDDETLHKCADKNAKFCKAKSSSRH